jgi:hypothetical protein
MFGFALEVIPNMSKNGMKKKRRALTILDGMIF